MNTTDLQKKLTELKQAMLDKAEQEEDTLLKIRIQCLAEEVTFAKRIVSECEKALNCE